MGTAQSVLKDSAMGRAKDEHAWGRPGPQEQDRTQQDGTTVRVPVSSYAQAVRGSGVHEHDRSDAESKTHDHGTTAGWPGETTIVGSKPARPTLWVEVRRLEERVETLAKQVEDGERSQAQLKRELCDHEYQARAEVTKKQTELDKMQKRLAHEKQLREHESDAYVREACAEGARKQTELEEMQKRLGHEKQLREEEGGKLRRANVMIKGKQQELEDLQAEHDRLQAIVEDHNAARLLAGGINIQADFPTLPEIEGKIRHALTVTASEWIEEALPVLRTKWIRWVLSQLFLECRAFVDGIEQQHTVFMEGGIEINGGVSTMDETTADTFRQHVRRHHRTLFPLTGEHLQQACADVICKLAFRAVRAYPHLSQVVVYQELTNTKLDRVIAEYLPILVGAKLQHPAVKFSEDCGTFQAFDATVYAESIDGDAVKNGDLCSIVFPSLLVEREGPQGFHSLTKPYILPVAADC